MLVLHALNNSGKDIVGYTFITRYNKPDGTIGKGQRKGYPYFSKTFSQQFFYMDISDF